jgi:hypothetical protein
VTVTYDANRDIEQLRLLTPAVDDFIAQCLNPPASPSTCKRQTMFFFPGGMASRLTRATQKFVDGTTVPQVFQYDPIWVIPDTPLGGAATLAMHRDSAGTFRDKGDRIIIADAPLSLAGCTPHNGLITWCSDHNVDLFVFPYDWRRRLDETAAFFVRKFLPFFRKRVKDAGCPDPLSRFALVGHSQGGMIANLILRGNDPILASMTHVITVGTPFYGYPGQVHRWYEGEPYLNLFGLFKQLMMETIASLPGLYVLHFLDEVTYRNSTNQSGLTINDKEFPLPDYPSIDRTNANVRADPYNPQTNGALVRYPTLTGFSRAELDYGRLQFQHLASSMDPALLQKFYNIRGVRTANDGTTPVKDTAGSVTWDWIATNFDANDTTPIEDGADVPGDNTQPAWTARLVTNADRVITVKAKDIDHAFLMNHTSVLAEIQKILCPEGAEMSPSATPQPEPASDDDVVEFLQWLSENRLQLRQFKSFDDPGFRELLQGRFSSRLAGIARRFLSDVMQRPGPKGLREPPEGEPGAREPRDAGGGATKTRTRQAVRPKAVARRGARKSSRKKAR